MAISYVCYRTDLFLKRFKKLDKPIQERLDKAIRETLMVDPIRNSDMLVGPKKGKRRFREGDYRIIFVVCHECRDQGYVRLNQCKDCDRHGRNDIIMFDVGHRGTDIYER